MRVATPEQYRAVTQRNQPAFGTGSVSPRGCNRRSVASPRLVAARRLVTGSLPAAGRRSSGAQWLPADHTATAERSAVPLAVVVHHRLQRLGEPPARFLDGLALDMQAGNLLDVRDVAAVS